MEVAMSNKKQSSIDWLVSILNKPGFAPVLTDLEIKQAKAMHKEEMRDLYLTHVTKAKRLRKIFEKQFDEYYNETFGGNQ